MYLRPFMKKFQNSIGITNWTMIKLIQSMALIADDFKKNYKIEL